MGFPPTPQTSIIGNMLRRQFATGVLCGVTAAVALSCKTVTSVTPTTAPNSGKPLAYLAVLGVAKRPQVRSVFEDSVVKAFEEKSVHAITSLALMNDPGPYSETQIHEAIATEGVDGVMVTRLVKVETKVEVTQGSGSGAYGGFYPTYAEAMSDVREFVTENFFLETKVYRIDTKELLWSANSETIAPPDTETAIQSYATAMVQSIIDAKLVIVGEGGTKA